MIVEVPFDSSIDFDLDLHRASLKELVGRIRELRDLDFNFNDMGGKLGDLLSLLDVWKKAKVPKVTQSPLV